VTAEASTGLGPLGRRLLVAFVAVALASVAVLTVAALIGTGRGLSAAQQDERERAATRTAEAAGRAYAEAGGWPAANLGPAQALAEGAGARLVVRDANGAMVWPGHGMGTAMHGTGSAGVGADVSVAGQTVGTVRLTFAAGAAAGRTVAWSWIAAAAAAALLVALAASWFVSRRITAPLVTMARAARAFAGGDRGARAGIRPPGELGQLARAFDAMAEDVERADRVRRQLAADVAHELRTPLAGLQAGLEELRDGLREPDRRGLASLHDQSLRLGRVVDDLAELSAAESAALTLHRSTVDLSEVARVALAGQEPGLRAAGLVVAADLDGQVLVRGDPDRLHQAIANLLTNAARYCRAGDRVELSVAAADSLGLVRVADTGPGIDPDALPHVFERLWRGPGSRSVAGSGIGLAVVRELVAAHGGTVDADSTPGRGSAFTIRLPLAPQGATPPRA
jgi:two-component system sensor histidine kinase BaeS